MDISKLTRDELIELQADIKARLETFKPFKIKEVFRTCSEPGCFCRTDKAYRHGPYLYVNWRDDGKTKTLSLGRKRTEDELEEMAETQFPNWHNYYTITPPQYQKLKDKASKAGDYIYLSSYSPEPVYGEENDIERYDTFYATDSRHEAYEAKRSQIDELREVATSKWSKNYGLGTVKGYKVLQGLINDGYYLKE